MLILLIIVFISDISIVLSITNASLAKFMPYQTRYAEDGLDCSFLIQHLLCNQVMGPVVNCIDFELFHMTTELKRRILAGHNGLRNLAAKRVGYEVANMNILHWDDDLSEMAKQELFRCNSVPYGEQTFIMSTKNLSISNNSFYMHGFPGYKKWLSVAIHSWLEHSYMYLDSKNITPYIQLIYPASEFVGCAGARVDQGTRFLCYYGPKVELNFSDQFIMGKWCSKCPPERSTCSLIFESLCGLDLFAGTNAIQSSSYLLFFTVLTVSIGFDY